MTKKFDDFVSELDALCKKHKVTIDPGYDGFSLWDCDEGDDYYEIKEYLDDCTKETDSTTQGKL